MIIYMGDGEAAAVERARTMTPGPERHRLVVALLNGPLRDEAPEWLLRAAIGRGLVIAGPDVTAARIALAHPSCPPGLRSVVVHRATDAQLAALGRHGCPRILLEALAEELDHRVQHQRSEPGAALTMLREPDLHEDLFAAALDRLRRNPPWPVSPATLRLMWGGILRAQPARHAEIRRWAENTPSAGHVRRLLAAARTPCGQGSGPPSA